MSPTAKQWEREVCVGDLHASLVGRFHDGHLFWVDWTVRSSAGATVLEGFLKWDGCQQWKRPTDRSFGFHADDEAGVREDVACMGLPPEERTRVEALILAIRATCGDAGFEV